MLLNPFLPVLEMNHASHPVLPAEKWGFRWVEGIFSTIWEGVRVNPRQRVISSFDHLWEEGQHHGMDWERKGLGICEVNLFKCTN